jgi:retron-type reverse transcriptase
MTVSWPFLLEVLERKQFPGKWIEWIQQVISGGRVGIKINGESGNFFRTYKGVRQGDPLSPLLFNLAVGALATMLERAKVAGLIKGLVPDLIEGGPTHLQYADDTAFFWRQKMNMWQI